MKTNTLMIAATRDSPQKRVGSTLPPLKPEGGRLEATVETEVLRIPLYRIGAYSKQPREYFDPLKMEEIVGSMRERGQITPGSVRKLTPPNGEHHFELIDGERRFRACAIAEIPFFRTVVETNVLTEKEQFERSAIANFCREDCAPLETAKMIQRFKSPEFEYTEEKISRILGRSVAYVRQYHALLRLHPDVQKLMDPSLPEEKRLTLTVAQKMLKFRPEWQIRLAQQITHDSLRMNEARHLIHKAYAQAGIMREERRPDKEFHVMAGFMQRMRGQLEMSKELADDYLREIFLCRTPEEHKQFLDDLGAVVNVASAFKQAVERIIANTSTRARRPEKTS